MTQEPPKLISEHATTSDPLDSTQPITEKPRESHLSGGVDFVLVTALEEEREAVLAQLPGHKKLPPSNKQIRTYYQAKLSVTFSDGEEGAYHVIVTSTLAMGRVDAATATTDAIERWAPRYVMLIGIAGGIAERGVRVGDVLVADKIVDYELQKMTLEGNEVRPEIYRADAYLLNACKNFTGKEWQQQTQTLRPEQGEPQRHIGNIASGDKVIASPEALARYRREWPKLIGVEMEAAGAAAAAYQSAAQPGLFMVRSVSDLADEQKGSAEVERWRTYACEVAAAFAISLLKSGPVVLNENKYGTAQYIALPRAMKVFLLLVALGLSLLLVIGIGQLIFSTNEANRSRAQTILEVQSEQATARAASETQEARDAAATNSAAADLRNATSTAEANIARTATAALEGIKALSEQLATSARALMDSNPQRGLLLSIEAVNITSRQNISSPFVNDTLKSALSLLGGYPLSGHTAEVNKVAFSRDLQWVATADDTGLVYLWDQQNFKRISLSGHNGAVTAMAFSPGSNWLATASADTTVRLWRMNSEEDEVHILDHESGVTSLAFSLYGTQLATGDEQGTIRLWDVVHEEEPPTLFIGHQDRINDIEYSPDGLYLATASQDGTARLWNLADIEEEPRRFDARVGPINALAFDPSVRWLITASADGRAYVWGAGATGGPKLLSSRHNEAVTALEISSDGNWIATGSIDHTVRLQSLTQEIAILTGHEHAIVALSFSEDNRWLVTGDSGGQVSLWDLSISSVDKQKPFVLRGHDQSGTFVAFRPDGKMLATAGCDVMVNDDCVLGSARLWDIGNSGPILRDYQDYTSEALVELACNTVGRNLTHAEWEIYFQNQPYRLICVQWAEPAY